MRIWDSNFGALEGFSVSGGPGCEGAEPGAFPEHGKKLPPHSQARDKTDLTVNVKPVDGGQGFSISYDFYFNRIFIAITCY